MTSMAMEEPGASIPNCSVCLAPVQDPFDLSQYMGCGHPGHLDCFHQWFCEHHPCERVIQMDGNEGDGMACVPCTAVFLHNQQEQNYPLHMQQQWAYCSNGHSCGDCSRCNPRCPMCRAVPENPVALRAALAAVMPAVPAPLAGGHVHGFGGPAALHPQPPAPHPLPVAVGNEFEQNALRQAVRIQILQAGGVLRPREDAMQMFDELIAGALQDDDNERVQRMQRRRQIAVEIYDQEDPPHVVPAPPASIAQLELEVDQPVPPAHAPAEPVMSDDELRAQLRQQIMEFGLERRDFLEALAAQFGDPHRHMRIANQIFDQMEGRPRNGLRHPNAGGYPRIPASVVKASGDSGGSIFSTLFPILGIGALVAAVVYAIHRITGQKKTQKRPAVGSTPAPRQAAHPA